MDRVEELRKKEESRALYNIGYGLYVITSRNQGKDNGLIINTVTQVTNQPNRLAVTINKQNYSHELIKATGQMNVNCLETAAPFALFQNFGFQSGRTADKFSTSYKELFGDELLLRSENGIVYLPRFINAFFSLQVEKSVELGTHEMFICGVTEARLRSDLETMTYSYYQANVKPKAPMPSALAASGQGNTTGGKKRRFVCKVCGYIYEGDELPEDFVCPICKHGAADFEEIV